MKENKIIILGKEYPLCFNAKAEEQIKDLFSTEDDEIDTSKIGIKDVDSLLKILMDSGRLYYKITERECPAPLPCDPSDVMDTNELGEALRVIIDTMTGDREREVETVDEKNAVAAQEN